jgi:7-carboxy-7-deazaguanine synthase
MFGKNEIVGQRYFREEGHKDQLLVTSIFRTIQGEGPFAGRPAIFLRTAKCNLSCAFCDTFFDAGDWFTQENLREDILTRARDDDMLVITGGEPLLQQDSLASFLDFLEPVWNNTIQIETNGILPVDDILGVDDDVQIVVSPKCSEGIKPHYLRPHDTAFQNACCLKFLISAHPDSPYHHLPNWEEIGVRQPVYISPITVYAREPEATKRLAQEPGIDIRSQLERISFWEDGMIDKEATRENYAYAAEYCLEHGFIMTMQMQLFAGIA